MRQMYERRVFPDERRVFPDERGKSMNLHAGYGPMERSENG